MEVRGSNARRVGRVQRSPLVRLLRFRCSQSHVHTRLSAAGYTFVTEGAGRGAKAEWVAKPLAEPHGQENSAGEPLLVTAALVTAIGVLLLGLGIWTRPRLYQKKPRT